MKGFVTCTLAVLFSLICASPIYAQGAGSEWDKLNQESLKLSQELKFDAAIVVAKQAVEVAERQVGQNHPDVATSLNNLAELYHTA